MRIPLATDLESRDGTLTKDAKVKNGIVETRGDGVAPIVRKRPGLTDLGLMNEGAAQLLYYWNGKTRSVTGDSFTSGLTGSLESNTTFNPADKDSDITLSNGDLTAATSSAAGSVRVVASFSAGEYWAEFTIGTAGAAAVGVCNASASLAGRFSSDANGLSYEASGQVSKNGSVLTSVASYTNADKIGVHINMTNGEVAFYKNGTLVYTATGSNVPTGDLFFAVGAYAPATTSITGNFGASAFTYYPTGYGTQSLSPSSAGLQFTAQDNGANSPESLLMIKNSTQAWTVDTDDTVTQITDTDYPGEYAVTLTSLTRSSTTATATTAVDTNFRAGDTVTVAGVNEAGWNGDYTILSTTRSGESIPAPNPVAITITRSGTTATATSVSQPHGFTNGQTVTIAGADQAGYNGAKTITWTSATTFTFTVTQTAAVTAAPATPATGSPAITSKTYSGLAYGDGSSQVSLLPYVNESDQATVSFFTGLTTGVSVTITYAQVDVSLIGTHAIAGAGIGGYGYVSHSHTWSGASGVTLYRAAPTISSITSDGSGTATVTTSAAHGYSTGQKVTITGATQWQYNVTDAFITVTGSATFTYSHPFTAAADSGPATPATGTITAQGPATVSGATFTFTVDGTETTPATGTITATSGRTTVPGIAYINGYFVVMDEQGVVYNSELDRPASWVALDYTSALNEPGSGKAIAKSGNYVCAFKEWSTEFFYDAKNSVGSPLSPVENGFTLVGCASGESVATVDGALMWIAQSKKQKGRSVYVMRGIEQGKVSTPAVERILNADTLATVRAWGATLDGHPLYILSLVASGVTLVYDASTGIWSQWSTLTIGSSVSVSSITRSGTTATVTCGSAHSLSDGDPVTISGATQSDYNGIFQVSRTSATVFDIEVENSPATPATGTILAYPYSESYFKLTHYTSADGDDVVLHATDGHIYELAPAVYQDDGVPVDYFIRTARLDGGSIRRKTLPRVSVIGESASDSAMLRFSDDDSATFTAYRRVTLSDADPNIRRCGAFERRSIELRHVGNTAPRLEALELTPGG